MEKKIMMKRIVAVLIVLAVMTGCTVVYAETSPAKTTKINAHFATVEEGQGLIRNRKLYHEQINEKNLAFLLQKKGGTLEEFIDYAAEQVVPFEPEEEQKINDNLEWLKGILEKHGLELPDPGTITFVKTTGEEAIGTIAYTSEGTVFLTETGFNYYQEYQEEEREKEFCDTIVHELFHCLSRLYPEYREAMYALIHFRVLDEDIDIPQNIRDEIMTNPDVEHHNSVATFTINGEKKDCYMVFLTDDVFEKEGDVFFEHAYSAVVPLGEDVIYRVEDVKDFWDVVGENTDYVDDPEEIMASSLALAILNLDDGYGQFANPEILEGIIEYLKK